VILPPPAILPHPVTQKIRRVGHLYDLAEINTSDVDRVVLKFRGPTDFEIDIQVPNAGTDLVKLVRQLFQEISFGFPPQACPKIVVTPTERGIEELPIGDPGVACGLLRSYKGWCDYFRQPENKMFCKFVEAAFESDTRELVLNQCPGIENRAALSLLPVAGALRYNVYFEKVSLRDVPRKDWGSAIANVMATNSILQVVDLRNVGAVEKDFVRLGNNLAENSLAAMTSLDASENDVGQKGAQALAEGFSKLSVNLSALFMQHCKLNSSGVGFIVQSLIGTGHALIDVNFSKNTVGPTGSSQLASYFSQPACVQALQNVYLSSCKLDVAVTMRALKTGEAGNTLVELDVSDNSMNTAAVAAMASLVDSCNNLKMLSVARCGLNGPMVSKVGTAIGGNSLLDDVTLDFSGNELQKRAAEDVAAIIDSVGNIGALFLVDCKISKDGLSTIFEALQQNTTLRVFDVSLNASAGSTAKMYRAMDKLAGALKVHPKLTYLGLAGDDGKKVIGREIEPVFTSLNENSVLEEIDVSGNKCGESAIITLFDVLRTNATLRSMTWDKNGTHLLAWQSLLNALQEGDNKTLCVCPPPRHDLDKGSSAAKDKVGFRKEAKTIVDGFREIVKANASSVGDSSQISAKKVSLGQRTLLNRTYTVTEFKPPPNVRQSIARGKEEGLIPTQENSSFNAKSAQDKENGDALEFSGDGFSSGDDREGEAFQEAQREKEEDFDDGNGGGDGGGHERTGDDASIAANANFTAKPRKAHGSIMAKTLLGDAPPPMMVPDLAGLIGKTPESTDSVNSDFSEETISKLAPAPPPPPGEDSDDPEPAGDSDVENWGEAPPPPAFPSARDHNDDVIADDDDHLELPSSFPNTPGHRGSFHSGIDPNTEYDDSKYDDDDGWGEEEEGEDDGSAPPPPPPF
jgi:Ran GTPase-activating protein (RanGAP) involved in mRNA processing and transport